MLLRPSYGSGCAARAMAVMSVIVATQVSDHADEITREGFKLIPIPLSRRTRDPIADLADLLELVSIYRREKPDIIHHVGMKPVLYGSWAAQFLRRSAVVNTFAGLGYVFTGSKSLSTRMVARGVVVMLLKSACKGSSRIMAIFQNPEDFEVLRACGVVTSSVATMVLPGSGVAEDKFVPVPEGAYRRPVGASCRAGACRQGHHRVCRMRRRSSSAVVSKPDLW